MDRCLCVCIRNLSAGSGIPAAGAPAANSATNLALGSEKFVPPWSKEVSTDMPKQLTDEIARAAIDGFEHRRLQIDGLIAELRTLLPGFSPEAPTASEPTPRKRRKMSATARRRIAAAQKARWAKTRGESRPGPAKVKAPKAKRRIIPEGLKRIIAATKKRWRIQRAAAKGKSAKAA
jgi:hypothetical protein